jgi:hypothetical protein
VITDPHHRIIAAKKCLMDSQEPANSLVGDLVLALTQDDKADPNLVRAVHKFLDPYQRAVLDAFCISGANAKEISDATEIPMPVIAAYQRYVYDMEALQDKLERTTWVRSISRHFEQDAVRLLQAAVTVGKGYLVWMLTGRGSLTPADVLRYSMNDAAMRGQAHKNAPLDSAVAKEAHQWIRTAERLAKALHAIDPQDAIEAHKQLQIALVYDDETVNEETSGIAPDQIVH